MALFFLYSAVSRSHRAHGRLYARLSKGCGAVERWRLGVRGSGSAVGVVGAVTGRLDRVRCTMTTSQRMRLG